MKKLLCIIFLLALALPAYAATYYLDCAAGDNGAAGGEETPWKDLDYAWSTSSGMTAGDTLIIEDGTCVRSASPNQATGVFAPEITGTNETTGRITIKARNEGQVTLDFENAEGVSNGMYFTTAKNYFRIEGLKFYNSYSHGVFMGSGSACETAPTHHISFYRCTFDHMWQSNTESQLAVIGAKEQTYDVEILSCVFSNNMGTSVVEAGLRYRHTIYATGVGWLIQNNVFYGSNAGRAIKFDGNCINDGDTAPPEGYDDPTHIVVNNTFGPRATGLTGHLLSGQDHLDEGDGWGRWNLLIANNAFANTPDGRVFDLLGDCTYEYPRIDLYNNYTDASSWGDDDGGCSLGADSNNVLNIVGSDFGFTSSTDLHISTDSILKEVGNATYAPALDIDGNARPQITLDDVGADEFVPPGVSPRTAAAIGPTSIDLIAYIGPTPIANVASYRGVPIVVAAVGWVPMEDAACVGAYYMNNNGGDESDRSGETHTLTQVGAIPTAEAYPSGYAGTSRVFQDNEYLYSADAAFDITGNISMGAWIYLANEVSDKYIITKYAVSSDERAFMLKWEADDHKLYCRLVPDSGTVITNQAVSSSTINDETWTHVFCVYDGTTIQTYINGQPDGAAFNYSDGIYDSTAQFRIGSYDAYDYNGNIDEAIIFNDALDATEVLSIFTDGIDGTKGGTD